MAKINGSESNNAHKIGLKPKRNPPLCNNTTDLSLLTHSEADDGVLPAPTHRVDPPINVTADNCRCCVQIMMATYPTGMGLGGLEEFSLDLTHFGPQLRLLSSSLIMPQCQQTI
jgi:hypothetical protein